jgi:predicted TPR repeat methyltransferase
LQLDPSNSLAAFWLAAVEPDAAAAAPVASCPSSLVAKLFDGYADNFDSHLVEKLQYKTPSMLM